MGCQAVAQMLWGMGWRAFGPNAVVLLSYVPITDLCPSPINARRHEGLFNATIEA
jgi:hypothetical protein